jgi:hypothetical protein
MPQTASVQGKIQIQQTQAGDLGGASAPIDLPFGYQFANGTGADQADLSFGDERTLASGANEDLDLTGSLARALGGTFDAARLKMLAIVADRTNTTVLTVTRPATNGAPIFAATGDGIPLRPGGMILLVSPDATGLATLTAGTADLLNIANAAGAAAKYKVAVLGASA